MERRVYDLFASRLPGATLISVAHRTGGLAAMPIPQIVSSFRAWRTMRVWSSVGRSWISR
jgi:hypothetical protein